MFADNSKKRLRINIT